jgi:hypothetical protein
VSKKYQEKQIPQLALSNRTVETAAQVTHVLHVIGNLAGALSQYQFRPMNLFDVDNGGTPKDPPPFKMTEGQIALEKTLWAACDRMEKILGDDTRWDSSFQTKVEKDYDELHKLQMDAIEKQRAAAEEVTSPHFRYHPALHRLQDGNGMAVLGDVKRLEFAVYGIGDSAQRALEEFDCVFRQGIPKNVAEWCQGREQDFESKRTLKPFPNKEQTHEKNNDDTELDKPGDGSRANPA